jgi:hypothetical protein
MTDHTSVVAAALVEAQTKGHVVALHDLLDGRMVEEVQELQLAYLSALTAHGIPHSVLFEG